MLFQSDCREFIESTISFLTSIAKVDLIFLILVLNLIIINRNKVQRHENALMSLENRHGAYANLGVKVMRYFLIQQVSRCVRQTFHQGQLELTGQRQMLSTLSEHFHEQIPRKH